MPEYLPIESINLSLNAIDSAGSRISSYATSGLLETSNIALEASNIELTQIASILEIIGGLIENITAIINQISKLEAAIAELKALLAASKAEGAEGAESGEESMLSGLTTETSTVVLKYLGETVTYTTTTTTNAMGDIVFSISTIARASVEEAVDVLSSSTDSFLDSLIEKNAALKTFIGKI